MASSYLLLGERNYSALRIITDPQEKGAIGGGNRNYPDREEITGSKERGAFGAPSALISSEWLGITRPQRIITDPQERGAVGGGFRHYSVPRGIKGSNEKGPQARRVLLSLMRERNYPARRNNYRPNSERGRRRMGSELPGPESQLRAQKRKGPSARRALLSVMRARN